ncbi:MAG: hypothetical protein IKD96_01340 [Oscillospiraceae bacterium]|nr:hypothetical protein [Oscillospiraceae bacterium]
MKNLLIEEITLREMEKNPNTNLSFKEKLEIAKLLDRLHVDVIALGSADADRSADAAVRAIASAVQNSVVSCPVGLEEGSAQRAWAAVSAAAHPRLEIVVPVSVVQMEYLCHLKPAKLAERVAQVAAECAALCPDVALCAEDATRAQPEFLKEVLAAVTAAGVKTVTVCDAAGQMLPGELAAFVRDIELPEDVTLGVRCRDELGLAAACALAVIGEGACQISGTFNGAGNTLALPHVIQTVRLRGEALDVSCGVAVTEMGRICQRLGRVAGGEREGRSAFSRVIGRPESAAPLAPLDASVSPTTLRRQVEALGYDLTVEDMDRLYSRYQEIAQHKPSLDIRDLEALIAETTRQVPPTYQLRDYTINVSSAVAGVASIRVERDGRQLDGVSGGDGSIDAAFLALEQIIGHHYELDDFQIRAVTEGREAMGEALVKLRDGGKLFSGRGLSTDIIAASIHAYLNAVNKIVHEENAV